MLEALSVGLIVLWLVCMLGSFTLGGAIHGLLVVAAVMFLVRAISRRTPV